MRGDSLMLYAIQGGKLSIPFTIIFDRRGSSIQIKIIIVELIELSQSTSLRRLSKITRLITYVKENS